MLDLTDEEARAALASYDWVTSLAEVDTEALASLMESVDVGGERLRVMFAEAIAGGVTPGQFPALPNGDKAPFQQMTFTLSDEQAGVVREAIKKAIASGPFVETDSENSNGNALARIAEAFIG